MITQQHGHALGSDIALTVRTSDADAATALLALLRSFLQDFEQRFSRFDPQSELTMVNEHVGQETTISPEFYELASLARRMVDETGGLYDPLLLPELQRAGYVGSWPAPEVRGAAPDYHARAGRRHEGMALTGNTITIPIGTALDFGGIGKGYALDKLADIAERAGCNDYWISLGGDVITRGVDDTGKPWQIGLEVRTGSDTLERFVSGEPDARIAVATSSRMRRKGQGWHHIIDPRTGESAQTPIEQVSLVAHNGVAADVYAKCLLIAGDDVAEYWRGHQQIAAFVQYHDRWEKLR